MTNQIVLTGNLGGPIELRFTKDGQAVANFSLADTPRRKNPQTNEWEDAGETLWAKCSIWGPEAEALAQSAGESKGRVTVVGRVEWETFERRDGSQGAALAIKATAATFHPPKQQSQPQGFGQSQGFEQMQTNQPAPGDVWGTQQDPAAPPF